MGRVKEEKVSEKVTFIQVDINDNDCRLDRWFKRHYPQLKQGMLQKLLRGKNIRVNGKRATSDMHVFAGDEIRVPPLDLEVKASEKKELSEKDKIFIQSCVIYKDDDMIVLNKPAGLAVQGGSKQTYHVDGLLDGLKYGGERPKLVHRLDKETSGVLVLARTNKAAQLLTRAFKTHEARKIYWALVIGCPKMKEGEINAPLIKKSGKNGSESVQVDIEKGQEAVSLYHVVDSLANKISWLELMPLTGRTHQLRVHCAYIGTPILGDTKYGGNIDKNQYQDISHRMYLHARAIQLPHPSKKIIEVYAPLPQEMKKSFEFFGFNDRNKENTFKIFEKKKRGF